MKKGGDKSPAGMKDRMAGKTKLSTTGIGSAKRSFDTGTNKLQGAGVAPYPGSAKSQNSAAKFNNSNSGLGSSAGGLGNAQVAVGRPVTAAPSYPGVAGGHGPKVRGGSTGKMVQKGASPGPDKSPKGMRDRFKGGMHG